MKIRNWFFCNGFQGAKSHLIALDDSGLHTADKTNNYVDDGIVE